MIQSNEENQTEKNQMEQTPVGQNNTTQEEIVYRNPKATTAAVLEKDGKILITKRNIEPYKEKWCIPGGHIEMFEKTKDAIIREVKEETGLTIDPEFFCYNDEIHKDLDWHAVTSIFIATPSGEEKMDEEEVQEMKWITLDEMDNYEFAFHHKEVLEKYKEAKNKTR